MAKNVARYVGSSSAREGLVIGIEGQWGSGKSSILNLLSDELRSVPNVSVVRFDPWIIGDRDAMVTTLIGDLATKVDALQADSEGALGKIKKESAELANALRIYGATASRGLSRLSKLGSLLGLPSEPVAAGLDSLTKILEGRAKPAPISVQRKELFSGLRKFGQRFVVVIDDLDRLEPREAGEVTRLIPAVGDFPHVVYLLCHD